MRDPAFRFGEAGTRPGGGAETWGKEPARRAAGTRARASLRVAPTRSLPSRDRLGADSAERLGARARISLRSRLPSSCGALARISPYFMVRISP